MVVRKDSPSVTYRRAYTKLLFLEPTPSRRCINKLYLYPYAFDFRTFLSGLRHSKDCWKVKCRIIGKPKLKRKYTSVDLGCRDAINTQSRYTRIAANTAPALHFQVIHHHPG